MSFRTHPELAGNELEILGLLRVGRTRLVEAACVPRTSADVRRPTVIRVPASAGLETAVCVRSNKPE